jgi:hypothetical protein
VIGLTRDNHLVLLLVDGRQAGVSEGMKASEAAELLRRDYGVVDALNLDGGGSTTLAVADPTPRVVNVPVGIDDVPRTLRAVGSNLAIFATAGDSPGFQDKPPASAGPQQSNNGKAAWTLWALAPGALLMLALWLRHRRRLRRSLAGGRHS